MGNLINSEAAVVNYTLSPEALDRFAEARRQEGRQAVLDEIAHKIESEYPTLTRKEAMQRLGISESTIILWGKRGLLRKVKHGHACYYYKEDIDHLLKYGTEK